jgi:formylglycine-generating enzyme required for sulfatase activity
LQSICDNTNESDQRKVRAGIALVPWDISHLGNLKESMLTTSPGDEFSAMLDILEQSAQQHGERQWLVNNLWFDLEKSPHVFQLASALAHYDPTHARWQKVSPKIVDALFDGEADNSLLWRPHLSHVWHHLEGSFVRRLLNEQDRSIRQAILLGLGESQPQRLSELCGESMISKIEDWYLHDTDPGIHGAARWILRQWGLDARITELDARLRSELPARPAAKDKNGWYVNEVGQTMIVISAPGRFEMGSPNSEQNRTPDETLHTEEITRSFAIASNEVTKDQYLQFFPDFDIHEKHLYPESDCPIGGVTLGEAAAYCNQLSRQEGIPEDQLCYVVTAPNKVRLVPDYVARAGYRLPTEAEWEYTCRAGTRTSWYHGPSLELLTDYGWFRHNSSNRTWPIASLKPNGFGIFDMHGNVYEWCHAHNGTLLRGGSFNSSAQHLRSANRLQYHPALRESLVPGFRVARTLNGWNP